MRGKNLIWASIVSLLVVSLVAGITNAAAATKIVLDPINVTGIMPGETIDVTVSVLDAYGVSAWEVRLDWDPFALKYMSGSLAEGTFLSDVGNTLFISKVSLLGEYILVGCMLMQQGSASGDGTLFTLSFMCVGAGQTKIAVSESHLFDENVVDLPHSSKDCQVTPKQIAEVLNAYPEFVHFYLGVSGDGQNNTLSANVENRHTEAVDVYVIFYGFDMDAVLIRITTDTVSIGAGATATLSGDFDAEYYGVGKYYFSARCFFFLGGNEYKGEKAKSTHFWVHE